MTDVVSYRDDAVGDKLTRLIKKSQDMLQVFDNVFLQNVLLCHILTFLLPCDHINTTWVDTGKKGPPD